MNWMYKIAQATPEDFQNLANAQRGEPEQAMLRIQRAQISQLYGWVAEHIGDLSHRMSEHIVEFSGQYSAVKDKVDKTLSSLTHPYGFLREVKQQIQSNIHYMQENHPEDNYLTDSDQAMERLIKLGRDYALAHQSLPVINKVQTIARDAAVAFGLFEFGLCRVKLFNLQEILNKGPSAWKSAAQEGLSI